MAGEPYWQGFPCEEHQMGFCPDCKPRERTVYITGGGDAYHLSPQCDLMESGQRSVDSQGGARAPIVTVKESRALADGRALCQGCSQQSKQQ